MVNHIVADAACSSHTGRARQARGWREHWLVSTKNGRGGVAVLEPCSGTDAGQQQQRHAGHVQAGPPPLQRNLPRKNDCSLDLLHTEEKGVDSVAGAWSASAPPRPPPPPPAGPPVPREHRDRGKKLIFLPANDVAYGIGVDLILWGGAGKGCGGN